MRLEQTENFNKQSGSSHDDLNLLGLMGKDKFDKFDKFDKYDHENEHENEQDDELNDPNGEEEGEPKEWMEDEDEGVCGKGKDRFDEGGKIDKSKKEDLYDNDKTKKLLKGSGSSGSSSDSGSLEFSNPYPVYSI